MTVRRLALVSGITAVAIFALTQPASTPARRFPPAQAREPERVQIEQEIVRIPVTALPAAAQRTSAHEPSGRTLASRRRAAAGGRPLVPETPRARAAAQAEPRAETDLFSRTVRRILGDGRYKPQPFPTVDKQK